MKKLILAVFFICLSTQASFSFEDELRAAAPILLQKGSFIKIINIRDISTAIADEGDEVSFVTPTNVWCGEALIFPKETIFYGFVEELHEPVQGTNASIKIKINKALLPDGTKYELDGHIIKNGDIKLGGELTAPMEYTKMPHYIEFRGINKGVLQFVPGNKRYFGQHLVLKSGLELFFVLNQDFYAKMIDF